MKAYLFTSAHSNKTSNNARRQLYHGQKWKEMKDKNCPRCGSVFGCYSEKCWCSELPPIMPMDEKGGCYCPKCLNEIIQEKITSVANKGKLNFMSKAKMIENIDYYINENNYWVFTSQYHLKRGFCCNSGCKHCPYPLIP